MSIRDRGLGTSPSNVVLRVSAARSFSTRSLRTAGVEELMAVEKRGEKTWIALTEVQSEI